MNWFGQKDDEDKKPKEMVGPPVRGGAPDPVVRDYLVKKYQQAGDTSGVEKAKADADRAETISLIGQSLGQILTAKGASRGGKAYDGSVLRGMADSARAKVDQAERERQGRMDQVLKEDQISWQEQQRQRQLEDNAFQDKERARKEKDWASQDEIKAREDDPNSEESRMVQALASKMMPGRDFRSASASQLRPLLSHIEKMYALEQGKLDRAAAAEERRRAEKDRQQYLEEGRLDKQIMRASDRLAPLQDLHNSLAAVEDKLGFKLEDYDQGKVNGKSVDLPGISLPGIGRVDLFSSDARELSGAISRVFNKELKDRSGAAVTTPEMERLRDEFNSGKFNSEEEMVHALKRYKAMAEQATRNAEAGFSSGVLREYQDRGGQTLRHRAAPTKRAVNEIRRLTKDGRQAIFDADTKEFIRYDE